jgi:hypothetical protein
VPERTTFSQFNKAGNIKIKDMYSYCRTGQSRQVTVPRERPNLDIHEHKNKLFLEMAKSYKKLGHDQNVQSLKKYLQHQTKLREFKTIKQYADAGYSEYVEQQQASLDPTSAL